MKKFYTSMRFYNIKLYLESFLESKRSQKGVKEEFFSFFLREKLIKIGEIHKIESQNAFVACNSKCVEPHGTIFSICKSCDQIDEISDKKLYKYLSEVRDMNGLKLSGYNLELFGTCKTCDQKHLQNMNQ